MRFPNKLSTQLWIPVLVVVLGWAIPAGGYSLAQMGQEEIGDVPTLPAEADSLIPATDVVNSGSNSDSEEPRVNEAAPSADDPIGIRGRWMFNGGFGASSDFVSGQVTVGYYWVRYVGVETTYTYYQMNTERQFSVQYGPEVDLMVRLYNPTIVTPIGGFGIGHTKWQRCYLGECFSGGSSFTGNTLFGIDIALTGHFGMQIIRKNINYFGSLPVSFADRTTPDSRSIWLTNIGFRVMF
jgi:hypothetical protein